MYNNPQTVPVSKVNHYCSEAHLSMHPGPLPSEEISLYFGPTRFLCVSLHNSDSKALSLSKTVLSALQIAVQNRGIQIPMFIKLITSKSEPPIIYGYFSYYALYTDFHTTIFTDFKNGITKYPNLKAILDDCINVRKVLQPIHESANIQAKFSHYFFSKYTDNKKFFLPNDIIKYLYLTSYKNNYQDKGKFILLINS